MASKRCLSVTKYFLFIFNLFFFMLGGVLLAFGLWILFDKSSFVSTLGITTFSMKIWSYFFSGVGTFTMMMGFLGCLGALKQLKWMLGFYFFLLILLFAAQITLGVLVYTQLGMIKTKVGEYMEQNIEHYGGPDMQPDVTESLDVIQQQLRCCGWKSSAEWKENIVIKKNSSSSSGSLYPCSCTNNTIDYSSEEMNVTRIPPEGHSPPSSLFCKADPYEVWSKGCMDVLVTWLKDNLIHIILVCLVIAVIELFGMILSMFLCRNLDQNYDKLSRYR